jgi:hypothetical protein
MKATSIDNQAPSLVLRGKSVDTVFDLLPKNENALTFSLAWALHKCPSLLESIANEIGLELSGIPQLTLQAAAEDRGFTDVEILAGSHLIIEAKKGLVLPSREQLKRYAKRFQVSGPKAAYLVISDCSEAFAKGHLLTKSTGFDVHYLSWETMVRLARNRRDDCTPYQKQLLDEIITYFSSLICMQDKQSNSVYVVVSSDQKPVWTNLTWRDFLIKQRVYFHPIKRGWPQRPPNYMGFRWDGKLQQIHHIDDFEVTDDVSKIVKNVNQKAWRKERYGENYFVYRLGPPIIPPREVRNGGLYPTARVIAALDLLLTCKTIKDAIKKTKHRLESA